MDSFYKYHVFFCLNQRDPGADAPELRELQCAGHAGACEKAREATRPRGPGKVRINKAGCLDRCELGPAVVVYPEGTWYTYVDESDIDEIVDSHLANGKVVERF